jgi:hypothetical protein
MVSSTPSPSESAPDARGARAIKNIKKKRKIALRDVSMMLGYFIPKRRYGVNVRDPLSKALRSATV